MLVERPGSGHLQVKGHAIWGMLAHMPKLPKQLPPRLRADAGALDLLLSVFCLLFGIENVCGSRKFCKNRATPAFIPTRRSLYEDVDNTGCYLLLARLGSFWSLGRRKQVCWDIQTSRPAILELGLCQYWTGRRGVACDPGHICGCRNAM